MESFLAFLKKLMKSEKFGKNLDNIKFVFKISALVIIAVFFIFELCQ